MCLYPKLIKNKKYTATKKNGGVIPPIYDERTRYIPVGCQNCIECRKKKSREWQVRLLEDIKTNRNGKFVTLTFSDKSIAKIVNMEPTKDWPGMKGLTGYALDNEIATRAVRLFLERWRKYYKTSLRHWFVTELGHEGTENIHLHGIVWTNADLAEVERVWEYGYVWKGKEQYHRLTGKKILTNYVNDTTIGYMTKYVTKMDDIHTQYRAIILTSPGIGNNYTEQEHGDWKRNKYKEKDTIETFRTGTGHKIGLPIYWRNKIYTEEEREKLWLEKLDKEERYILGQRIDISGGDEEYIRGLKTAQEKNSRLGYGNDTKDWKQEQYERERRIIMQKTRIAKAKKKEIDIDNKAVAP